MMWFQVLLYLLIVTNWLWLDKIPEIAKTEVSKPKRYSWSNLRFYHTPLKWLSQTHPHMSTSRCGNICIRHVSVTAIVLKQPWQREAVNRNAFYGRQSRLELMVILRTLHLHSFLYIHFESSRLWRGVLHFRCRLWCSANHNALCQLANQSKLCLSEGGTL